MSDSAAQRTLDEEAAAAAGQPGSGGVSNAESERCKASAVSPDDSAANASPGSASSPVPPDAESGPADIAVQASGALSIESGQSVQTPAVGAGEVAAADADSLGGAIEPAPVPSGLSAEGKEVERASEEDDLAGMWSDEEDEDEDGAEVVEEDVGGESAPPGETAATSPYDERVKDLKTRIPELDRAIASAVLADPKLLPDSIYRVIRKTRDLRVNNDRDLRRLQQAYVRLETARLHLVPVLDAADTLAKGVSPQDLLRSAAASRALPEDQLRLSGSLMRTIMSYPEMQEMLFQHLSTEEWERVFSTRTMFAEPASFSLRNAAAAEEDLALGDSVSDRADLINRAFSTVHMRRWADNVGAGDSAFDAARRRLKEEAQSRDDRVVESQLLPLRAALSPDDAARIATGQLHVRFALRKHVAPIVEGVLRRVHAGERFDTELDAHLDLDAAADAGMRLDTIGAFNEHAVPKAMVQSQTRALRACLDVAERLLDAFFGDGALTNAPPLCAIAAKYASALAAEVESREVEGDDDDDDERDDDDDEGAGGGAAAAPATSASGAVEEDLGTQVVRECAMTLVDTLLGRSIREALVHGAGALTVPSALMRDLVGADASLEQLDVQVAWDSCAVRAGAVTAFDRIVQLVRCAAGRVPVHAGFMGLTDAEHMKCIADFAGRWGGRVLETLGELAGKARFAMTKSRLAYDPSPELEKARILSSMVPPARALLRVGDLVRVRDLVEAHFRMPREEREFSQISAATARAARAAFSIASEPGSSKLSAAGIHEALKLMGHRLADRDLLFMIGGLANNPDGSIDFSAFVRILSQLLNDRTERRRIVYPEIEALFRFWAAHPLDEAIAKAKVEAGTLVEVPMAQIAGTSGASSLSAIVTEAFAADSGFVFVANELRWLLRVTPAALFHQAVRGSLSMRGVDVDCASENEEDAAMQRWHRSLPAEDAVVDSNSLRARYEAREEAVHCALALQRRGEARTEALMRVLRAHTTPDAAAAGDIDSADVKAEHAALQEESGAPAGQSSPTGRTRRLSLAELTNRTDVDGVLRTMTARLVGASPAAGEEEAERRRDLSGVGLTSQEGGIHEEHLTVAFRHLVRHHGVDAFLRVYREESAAGVSAFAQRKLRLSARDLPKYGSSFAEECNPFVRVQVINDRSSAVVFQAETPALAGEQHPEWADSIQLPRINRAPDHSIAITVVTTNAHGGRQVIGSVRRPLVDLAVGEGQDTLECEHHFTTTKDGTATLHLAVSDVGYHASSEEAAAILEACTQGAVLDAIDLAAECAARRGEKAVVLRANRLRVALSHLVAMRNRRLDPSVIKRVMDRARQAEADAVALQHFLETRLRVHGAERSNAQVIRYNMTTPRVGGRGRGGGGNGRGAAEVSLSVAAQRLLRSSDEESEGVRLGGKLLSLIAALEDVNDPSSIPSRTVIDLLAAATAADRDNQRARSLWARRFRHQRVARQIILQTKRATESQCKLLEGAVENIRKGITDSIPVEIVPHQLFSVKRDRFFAFTVPELIQRHLVLPTSALLETQTGRRTTAAFGVDTEGNFLFHVGKRGVVVVNMRSSIAEIVQVHNVGSDHSPRGRLVVEELDFDTMQLIKLLLSDTPAQCYADVMRKLGMADPPQ